MNTFGRLFRISIYGESHGPGIGIVIDGCPPGLTLDEGLLDRDLARRKPGASGTTARVEPDRPVFYSGIFNKWTTGAPIHIHFENTNTRSSDYDKLREIPRPGHADFTASQKFFGFEDFRGGGHFSGRLTTCLVAAGSIAKMALKQLWGKEFTIEVNLLEAGGEVDIESALQKAIEKGDSIGGIVGCTVNGIPPGLGEPFFDSLESLLSHAVFAIPAIKGIEFGAGFSAARMWGSEHNDPILDARGTTATNNSGGINGGISNGNPLIFRVAVKPPSSTPATQRSYSRLTGQLEQLSVTGRHDLCIALRVPVVLEAVTAIVLADLALLRRAYTLSPPAEPEV